MSMFVERENERLFCSDKHTASSDFRALGQIALMLFMDFNIGISYSKMCKYSDITLLEYVEK